MLKHNFTADGNSASAIWNGGEGIITVSGSFGSGTVKFQISRDNGATWIDPANGSFTAADAKRFKLKSGYLVRFNLSGSTSPDIDAEIT